MALNTLKRLPRFLRSIPFWKDFIEVIDEEFTLFKAEIDKKKTFFSPRDLDDIESLRALNKFFGFNVDLALLNDKYGVDDASIIQYLKQEAENMVLKVRSKGMASYHRYIFDRIAESGYVYTMFHDAQDGGSFYRAINLYDADRGKIQERIIEHDFTQGPYTTVNPLYPFRDGFIVQNNLDGDLSLDSGWEFDYSLYGLSSVLTKHIAIEFMADKTFTVGSDEKLITDVRLEYLKRSMAFGKRAVEIPHAGIGVTAYTKMDELSFTVPGIDVSTQVTASWTANSRTILNDLYHYFSYGSHYTKKIANSQIYSDTDIDMINITVPGNKVMPEVVANGDGAGNAFTFTLAYVPVDPKTFKLTYSDVNQISREIRDDGSGNLYYPDLYTEDKDITDFFIGTINYETGEVSISTIDTRDIPEVLTPELSTELTASYYTFWGSSATSLKIYDSNDNEVVDIQFPAIDLNDKSYHASFLVVVDRRS